MQTRLAAARRLVNQYRPLRSPYQILGCFFVAMTFFILAVIYLADRLDFNSGKFSEADAVAFLLSAFLAIGLALISIHYAGVTIRDFYNFRQTGIMTADPDFGLRNYHQDQFFADLVNTARSEIILCGSSLSGWFRNDDHIKNFIQRLTDGLTITLLFLDPESANFKDRRRSEREKKQEDLRERLHTSLTLLKEHFEQLEPFLQSNKLRLYIYDNEPMSLVIFDRKAYWFIYLPNLPNKDSLKLELARGGLFADKVCQSVSTIIDDCRAKSREIRGAATIEKLIRQLEEME